MMSEVLTYLGMWAGGSIVVGLLAGVLIGFIAFLLEQ